MKIKKVIDITNEIGIFRGIYWLFLKKFNKKIYDKKILEFLKKENLDILEKYKSYERSEESIKEDDYIWFFWWQGPKKMPPIVKKCYESLNKYSDKHKIIFLWKNNFDEYSNLPYELLEKFKEGKYSITHFSDILRMNLLSIKGGVWVDATIYFTDYFLKEVDNKTSIYTRRSRNTTKYISNGMWSSYFIATSKDNILSSAAYEILCRYWKIHDGVIEYLLTDYIIYLLYEHIIEVRRQLELVPYNNEGIHELESLLDCTFNLEDYKNICSNTSMHKLNWKKKYRIKDKEEKFTYYGYILNQDNKE